MNTDYDFLKDRVKKEIHFYAKSWGKSPRYYIVQIDRLGNMRIDKLRTMQSLKNICLLRNIGICDDQYFAFCNKNGQIFYDTLHGVSKDVKVPKGFVKFLEDNN